MRTSRAVGRSDEDLLAIVGPRFSGYDLPGVEFDKHSCVRLKIFHRYEKPEVVEEEELHLQVVEFGKWKSTNLCPLAFCPIIEPNQRDVPWHISSSCRTRPRRICSRTSPQR